jgi:U3 small nucleolar ribonucleoprotein component
LTLKSEADETKAAGWERQKADLREQIEQLEHQVDSLAKKRGHSQ